MGVALALNAKTLELRKTRDELAPALPWGSSDTGSELAVSGVEPRAVALCCAG